MKKAKCRLIFIDCILWGKRAEVFVQYTCKGALVGVIGEINKNKYESKGETKYDVTLSCRNFQLIEPRSVIQERMERQGMTAVLKDSDPELPLEIVEDDLPF